MSIKVCDYKYSGRGGGEEMEDAINLNKEPWQVQVHFIATTWIAGGNDNTPAPTGEEKFWWQWARAKKAWVDQVSISSSADWRVVQCY